MGTVVEYLSAAIEGKPIDGSDVKTLAQARSELSRLRRVAYRVCDILNKTTRVIPSSSERDLTPPATAIKKPREAVADNHSYDNYKKVVVPKSEGVRGLLKLAMQKNLLFKGCSEAELDNFADVFVPKKSIGRSTVIKQGDKGDTFYIVQSGALDIFINVGEGKDKTETQVGVPYGPGMAFGELALIYNSPRAATIRTSDDCVLWEINRVAFKGLQLQHEQKAHKLKLSSLRNVKIGKKILADVLSTSDIESMALAVKTESFSKGDVIIREGEKGDVFYMITKGTVVVSKEKQKLCSIDVNGTFGERALLSAETRQATCIAETNLECLTLFRGDFALLLGNLEDLLAGKKVARPSLFIQKAVTTKYAMADLKKGGLLGEGAFGKVHVAKSLEDGKFYALKSQSKAFLIKNGQQAHAIAEYQLIRECNHPFIAKIYQALQDKKFIYYLMTLLPGGELMDLLNSLHNFPENWTRFYGGTVLSAFQCIHENKIAYRDLKPENLVLDPEGYCYIIDFGLAKKCDKGKTWTFCGTPEYLAPEIIRGKGHDWGVDYWELGIFLFEITHGYPPFYANDPTQTARKIIKGSFSIPSKFSQSLSDLITKLLCDQSKRLGRTQGGVAEIIKHQWFSGFDWDALLGKTMKAPWKPNAKDLERLGGRDKKGLKVPDSSWNPVFDQLD